MQRDWRREYERGRSIQVRGQDCSERTPKRVCSCYLERARALPLVPNRMPHDHHADDCVILAELLRSSGLGISTGKPSPSWAGRVAEEFCSAVKIAPGERIFQLCVVRFGINDLVSVRYFLLQN